MRISLWVRASEWPCAFGLGSLVDRHQLLGTAATRNPEDEAGRGDRATGREPVRRYQRESPGELIHVDVKKIAGIPDGGGWRTRGRGYPGEGSVTRQVGYRYIHTAIDDRSRLIYSEIHNDEQATTAAGFWTRAVRLVPGERHRL